MFQSRQEPFRPGSRTDCGKTAVPGVALYLMTGIRHHNLTLLHLISGMPLGPELSIVLKLWTA